jgi:hypothetical protein
MTHKTAYLWGPISSFSGPLAALLLQKDWQVHVAVKSALNIFTLSPLDLESAAHTLMERALGGHDKLKTFQDRLRFTESVDRGTKYDAVIFCGLPPNFDEPRAPRAPWAASEFSSLTRALREVPTFIVSSLWGGIQSDGVVPEEFEFDRRKPTSHWENVCQQYEQKLFRGVAHLEAPWTLIRLPIITGSTQDGKGLNFSGLYTLLDAVSHHSPDPNAERKTLRLGYNPDSTFWFLPVDFATHLFWRLIEDENRPRICNLVPTNPMLNREWLPYLAQALGYSDVQPTGDDGFDLPGILRKLLNHDVMVRTRNLFEVMGRYHQAPLTLDASYFEKMLHYGKNENWGRFVDQPGKQPLSFSPELAQRYFCEFVPGQLESKHFSEVTKGGTTIGFYINGAHNLSWVLKAEQNQAAVAPLDENADHPRVKIHLDSQSLPRLIQNKIGFHEALLRGQVRLEGRVVDTLRVGNVLSEFLRKHPYAGE